MTDMFDRFQPPETPALDQYRGYLQEGPPDYNQYRPGFGKRLLSSLAAGFTGATEGMGRGIQMGEQLRDAPYRMAYGNWQARGKQLGDLADVEAKYSDVNRKWMSDVAEIIDRQEDNERAEETADVDRWFKGEQVGNWQRDDTRAEAELGETRRWHDISGGNMADEARHRRVMEGIAGRNADTAAARGRDYGEYLKRGGRTTGAMRRIPTGEIDEAKQMAIDEVIGEDPTASKFYTQNDSGRWFEKGTVERFFGEREPNEEEIRHRSDIRARVEKRRQEILEKIFDPYNRENPFGEPPPE